jgi:hypothetical protein
MYNNQSINFILYKNHLHDHHRKLGVNKAIINIKSETLLTKFGLGEQDWHLIIPIYFLEWPGHKFRLVGWPPVK